MSAPAAPLTAGFLALLCACGGSVFQQSRFLGGQDRTEAWGKLVRGEDASRTKAEILASLGPPEEVVPLAGGDIFVYRLRNVATDVFQLNSGMFGAGSLPIYARVSGRRVDQVVFVRFDRLGQVVDISSSGGAW